MKKVITILCICLLLTGCSKTSESDGNTFVTIEDNWGYKIVYHRDTKVMYTISWDTNNRGDFTLLVNADGTPMVYDESEVKE